MRVSLIIRSAFACCCSLLLVSYAYADTYSFQTVNNPGDPAFNQLLGINNSGTIAGYFGDGSSVPNNGYTIATPYSAGNFNAENFLGAPQTQVTGINSAGSTVGFYINSVGQNVGFVTVGPGTISVSDPNTPNSPTSVNQLLGINANGIAAGFYVDSNGDQHPYLYNTVTHVFTAINLPSNFNTATAVATGVNNAGVVTGFYTDHSGLQHGFVDNGGVFTKVDDPLGVITDIFGLNNNLLAVGSYTDSGGNTQGFIDNLATNTFQTISDPNASQNVAFAIAGTTVNGINDQGDLVGFYSDGTNVNGFVAAPTVPEPSTWLLLATGVLGIGASLRRKQRYLQGY